MNQGTFMFVEYKTRENIRQSNVKFMTIKRNLYRSRYLFELENKMNEFNNTLEKWQPFVTY